MYRLFIVMLLMTIQFALFGQSRIVGGNSTSIEEVPWQVALVDDYNQQFCGGSIIDSVWILTAAHCIENMRAADMSVAYGIDVLSSDSVNYAGVELIIAHPSYSSETMQNDIALLKLSEPVSFSPKAQVIPIVGAYQVEAGITDEGKTTRISGWGLLQQGAWDAVDTLQMVETPIVSNERANIASRYDGQVTDDMLAAGDTLAGGEDACQGDSGGPLAVYDEIDSIWRLAGVVSWGEGCAQADYPGIYARVSYFESWIYNRMNGGPMAAFSASEEFIFENDTIEFINESSSDPTDFEWYFEGGTPSTSNEMHPSVSYQAEGLYDVQLIAKNQKGSDTILLQDFIRVVGLNTCDSIFYMSNNDGTNLELEDFDIGWDDMSEGYFAGNNAYEGVGVFEYFSSDVDRSVYGANLTFGKAVAGSEESTIELALFMPGQAEASLTKRIKIKTIEADIAAGRKTEVLFGGALSIGSEFLLGIIPSYDEGDTVALMTQSSAENHAWTYYGEYYGWIEWYSFEEDFNKRSSLAIEAIVCKDVNDSMQIVADTSQDTTVIDTTSSVQDRNFAAGFKIYPNPITDGAINISCEEIINAVNIYSVQGLKVKHLATRHTFIEVPVYQLDAGIYFVEVITNRGHFRKRIVIN